jgi:hypothetical protein
MKKNFRYGSKTFSGQIDFFNLLNGNAIFARQDAVGNSLGDVTTILQGRLIRLAFQMKFWASRTRRCRSDSVDIESHRKDVHRVGIEIRLRRSLIEIHPHLVPTPRHGSRLRTSSRASSLA